MGASVCVYFFLLVFLHLCVSAYLCTYVSECVSLCADLCMSLPLNVYNFVCMSLYVYAYRSLCGWVYVYVCFRRFVFVNMYVSGVYAEPKKILQTVLVDSSAEMDVQRDRIYWSA